MELCGFAFCFFLQQWLLQEVVNKFQNDPKYSVLLATAQEGACFARFVSFAQNEWALRMHDFGVTCEVETLHVFGPWSKLKPNTWSGPVTRDLSSSLTSSQVGGVGLTLTAANHVIHFDRPYNPAREDQAPGVVQGSIRSIQLIVGRWWGYWPGPSHWAEENCFCTLPRHQGERGDLETPVFRGSVFGEMYQMLMRKRHVDLQNVWVECDRSSAKDSTCFFFKCLILTSNHFNIFVRNLQLFYKDFIQIVAFLSAAALETQTALSGHLRRTLGQDPRGETTTRRTRWGRPLDKSSCGVFLPLPGWFYGWKWWSDQKSRWLKLKWSNFSDVFFPRFWVSDVGVHLRRNMACRLWRCRAQRVFLTFMLRSWRARHRFIRLAGYSCHGCCHQNGKFW